jgi:hypothetical protein
MAQYAVPDADIVDGSWLNQAGSGVNIFSSIAPDMPGSIGAGDDTDYAESPLAPVNEACAFGLSNVEDPVSSSGHVMRWRRGKNSAGGATIDLTVQLRQGYINEGTPGSLINSFSDTTIPDAFTTTTDTLSGAEADAITDYADLQVRFVANQP